MPETVRDCAHCEKCKQPYKPASMLMGTTPGATCGCGWMTMPERDFRDMFGVSYKQMYSTNQITELPNLPDEYDDSFCLLEPSYSGNSHQRKKQRKAFLRNVTRAV